MNVIKEIKPIRAIISCKVVTDRIANADIQENPKINASQLTAFTIRPAMTEV